VEVRCAALRALREIARPGNFDALETIHQCLEEPKVSPAIKLEAVESLRAVAFRGDLRSARAAVFALTDQDPGVFSGGMAALKSICAHKECAEMLGELGELAAGHHNLDVRCAALEVMTQIEGEGGAFGCQVCSLALQDREERVRATALTSLRRMWTFGDPKAFETVCGIIAGTACPRADSRLRCEALQALPRIVSCPHTRATKVVMEVLNDEDDSVRLAASQVLKGVCKQGDPDVVDFLLAYTSHPEPEVQRLAVEALGAIALRGDAKVKEVLQKKANCGDDPVQFSAQSALRYLN